MITVNTLLKILMLFLVTIINPSLYLKIHKYELMKIKKVYYCLFFNREVWFIKSTYYYVLILNVKMWYF